MVNDKGELKEYMRFEHESYGIILRPGGFSIVDKEKDNSVGIIWEKDEINVFINHEREIKLPKNKIQWKRKIVKHGHSIYVSIPPEILNAGGLEKNDDAIIELDSDKIKDGIRINFPKIR